MWVKGRVECGGTARTTNRVALRLGAPVQTQWNSVFECINSAFHLKDGITKFSENDMEFDGRIGSEDDEKTSDGEIGRVRRNAAQNTSPFFVVPSYIC